MNRWITLCVALLSAAVLTPALRSADDSIGAKLERARAAYRREIAKNFADVAASFDRREETARKYGNKKLLDEIKAERQAFDLQGKLPPSVSAALKTRIAGTCSTMHAAYQTAIREYIRAKQDEAAAAVEKELQYFLAANPLGPALGNAGGAKLVAIWEMQIPPGSSPRQMTKKLYSNGRSGGPESNSTWTIQHGKLIIVEPSPTAPGGAWQNVAQLSADGRFCQGKNNSGTQIVGRRIYPE
jgi:hypothetical protein